MKRFLKKYLSIKLRVTLWYTFFMTLLVIIVFTFMGLMIEKVVDTSFKNEIIETVHQSFKEIEMKPEGLEIDDDLDIVRRNIYISIYDENYNLIHGIIPNGFIATKQFVTEKVETFRSNSINWYVYQERIMINNYGVLIVRAVTKQSNSNEIMNTIMKITVLVLPFLVILFSIGGYIIIDRAFLPIRQIEEIANRIGDANDLSQRINIKEQWAIPKDYKGKDEIYELANIFDKMFDRLEVSFENEKQFISDVSHELRTPIAVIISQCEFALDNTDVNKETSDRILVILKKSKQMSAMIAQLLTMSRIAKGYQKLNIERINFSELTEIIVEEQRNIAAKRNIYIQTEIEPDIWINADETLIMRALINLISNSINYGKKNGETIVEISDAGKNVECSVEDNGIGISKNNIDKIWNKFFRVDSSRTNDTGIGLGLSMVKWIIETHNGSISVESELGEGTKFTFFLPKN